MAKYLDGKKHPKADEVLTYVFENVPFKWQTRKHDQDCGVYMMHHLMHFDGAMYSEPNLCKANIRRALRAEICIEIVLSSINNDKSQVIQAVKQFHEKKPALIEEIAEKRKKVYRRKQKVFKGKKGCSDETFVN